MKLSFVSSQAISQALRYQTQRVQAELVKASKESVEGRYADIGVALGARTGVSVSMHREIDRLKGLRDSNQVAASRLDSTQVGLQGLTEAATKLRSDYLSAYSAASDVGIVRQEAENALAMMTTLLNTNLAGEHIFAGINTDVKPIADFTDPASPNRQALETAFATFPFADPADITPAEMEAFLAGVEDQFLGSGWNSLWSSATDQQITSRITLTETAQTSVSANIEGVRKLAMSAAVVMVALSDALSPETRQVLLEGATALADQAVSDLAAQQGHTGIAQQRIERANERMTMQIDIFNNSLIDMEGVDEYEAISRVKHLEAQLELSYTLTGRFQQMNLMRFLS